MLEFFQLSPEITSSVIGLVAGVACGLLTAFVFRRYDEACGGWPVWSGIAATLLCGVFSFAMLVGQVQRTPEVIPGEFWGPMRIVFHVTLIVLLVAATAIDLKAFLIPDEITLPGTLLAVILATIAGDLQMAHLWVDWNHEIPQIRGPWIPDWIRLRPHLHGAAWSLAGLVAGGGTTWLVRVLTSKLLGKEALGFGDVTLMAMIGAFLGWQAVLVTFMLAPIAGLCAAVTLAVTRSRAILPYGPYLSIAAITTMFAWGPLWMFELHLSGQSVHPDRVNTFAVRRFFGDWPSLLIIGGSVLAGIIVLSGLMRVYSSIPVTRRVARDESPDVPVES
ncbi:prepilin peptidase [Maioricimonas rarisocia]|uniref:prepilin peptidase n=1 Tax=Maioricimonas rarisocia TaxID=2528026 RepID=UPI0018D220B0|nr:A24 family peptidase [Maioricimonas rarisocia]